VKASGIGGFSVATVVRTTRFERRDHDCVGTASPGRYIIQFSSCSRAGTVLSLRDGTRFTITERTRESEVIPKRGNGDEITDHSRASRHARRYRIVITRQAQQNGLVRNT
jgi:hypothetical protein